MCDSSARGVSDGRAAPDPRWWIVIVLGVPKRGDPTLRRAIGFLRACGARRLIPGVYLVRDRESMYERLHSLAEQVGNVGGQVIIADSRVLAGNTREGG